MYWCNILQILSTSSGRFCQKCSSLTTLKYSTSTLASLNAGILDSIGGGSCRPRCLQETQKRPQNACRNHEKPPVFWSVLCQIHPSLSEVSLMKGRNLLATSSEFLADTTRPISTTKSSTDLGEKLTFMDVWSCTKVVSEHAQHIPTCSWFGTWNHDLPSRTGFFQNWVLIIW